MAPPATGTHGQVVGVFEGRYLLPQRSVAFGALMGHPVVALDARYAGRSVFGVTLSGATGHRLSTFRIFVAANAAVIRDERSGRAERVQRDRFILPEPIEGVGGLDYDDVPEPGDRRVANVTPVAGNFGVIRALPALILWIDDVTAPAAEKGAGRHGYGHREDGYDDPTGHGSHNIEPFSVGESMAPICKRIGCSLGHQ